MIVCLLTLAACKKDEIEHPLSIPSEYVFTGISENNIMYGYTNVEGNVEKIPQDEIDVSIFDECKNVQIVDQLNFVSENLVSFKSFDTYSDSSRIEENNYDFIEDKIGFDLIDEWGNTYAALFFVDNDVLKLRVYSYITKRNVFGDNFEVYALGGSIGEGEAVGGIQSVGESDVLSRASGLDEGESVYMMVYEQIYGIQ